MVRLLLHISYAIRVFLFSPKHLQIYQEKGKIVKPFCIISNSLSSMIAERRLTKIMKNMYQLSREQVLAQMQSTTGGLSAEEANQRKKTFGWNELESSTTFSK